MRRLLVPVWAVASRSLQLFALPMEAVEQVLILGAALAEGVGECEREDGKRDEVEPGKDSPCPGDAFEQPGAEKGTERKIRKYEMPKPAILLP